MDLKLNNLSKFALDNGYMPVEYIQTSGYPNINTGVSYYYGTRNLEVDLVINVISNSNNNSVIFDASNGVRQTYLKCTTADDNTSFVTKYYQLENATATSVEFNGKTHIVESLNHLKINDTEYTFSSNASAAVSATLYLFKSGSTVTNVYSFKVRQSTTIIRDFIPAISYQEGHFGEACLYDKINNAFYYSASTGSFTAPASLNIYNTITKAFVKDCPNVSGIGLLRKAINLERVRCNISNVLGTLEELQHYATLSGYSDSYEEQTKPRIIGTFTVSNYHTNAELEALNGLIDELTIISDNNYNIDYLITNNNLAIQTFSTEASNYNPAVTIILSNNNIGYVHNTTTDINGGRYLLKKTEAASETSLPIGLFRGITSITDTDGIVTSDTTETYNFEEFNEFKYWTGLTTITAGTGTAETTVGAFGLCTNLESIELPEGLTTIGAYAFYGDTALNRIVIPSTLATTGDYCFSSCTSMVDGDVYYNGTLQQWMNITFNATDAVRETSPMAQGSHFYLNGEELTQLTIPAGTTQIKNKTFHGFKYLTGSLIIPNTVTSIGNSAFRKCSGFTGTLTIPSSVTSIGTHAFYGCSGLTGTLTLPQGLTTINTATFYGCSGLTGNLVIPSSVTSIGQYAFSNCSGLAGDIIIPSSVTTIGNYSFQGLPNVNNFICNSTVNLNLEHINNLGKGTGICILKGSFTTSNGATGITGPRFKKFIVYGKLLSTSAYPVSMSGVIELRLKEAIDKRTTFTGKNGYSFSAPPTFLECNDISVSNSVAIYGGTSTFIAFIRKNDIPTATPALCGVSKMSTIYVGDGSSRANDEAVLALYLANTSWSSYSAKLATWYDYNGTYKWYYITDNLTNCTNTNPDEWPHITRGESYETTIVPDEGMTIDSLTVEMLDTDTTSPTYDTYIPQPTSYDSATGIYTISIPSVTGNVVITASAS